MKHCDKVAVTVNTTNKCNLRCEYCMASSAEEQKAPINIPFKFAQKGIYDAINGNPTGVKASMLRFFSPGEPTQNMSSLRACIEYARYLNPQIKVELQTNGLFPSANDTEWISQNIDIVWFSLDGPPEVNDIHRPDENGNGRTLDIEKNMAIVARSAAVGVRATIVEETLNHQDELVEYYYERGITNLGFNPVIRPIRRKDHGNMEVTRISIMNFAKGFLKAYKKAKELGVVLASSLTFNFDETTKIACRCLIPMPQLNPDASVSSCDMALYGDTKKELQCFIYGQWSENSGAINYDMEKIEYLRNRNIYNIPACKKCDIKNYCAGGCAGRVAYQVGNIYEIMPEYCAATKFLAKYMTLGERNFVLTHP